MELIDVITSKENLNRAYKKAAANKGAGGVDGMKVGELGAYIKGNKESWGRKRMAEKISVTVRYIRNHADTWTGNPHLSSVWKSADHLS